MTYPPPGPVDGAPTESRSAGPWRWYAIVALAVLLVGGGTAGAIALTGGSSSPPVAAATPSSTAVSLTASSTPSPDPGPTSSPSPTPPAGPTYRVDGGLCNKIAFGSLGDWVPHRPILTYGHPETRRDVNSTEVGCYFNVTGGARLVEVDVSFRVYPSVSAARSGYANVTETPDGVTRFTVTHFVDKPLSGYGDEARGYYHSAVVTSPNDYAYSWYMVQALTGTLVVLVSVEVKSFDTSPVIPKAVMLKRVGQQTKAVTALVPKA